MKLDLTKIPFSTFSSFLAISSGILKEKKESDGTLYIRDLSGGDESFGYICALQVVDKNKTPLKYSYRCDETELIIISEASKGELHICFSDDGTLHLRGNSIAISLDFFLGSYDHINRITDEQAELHSYTNHMKMMMNVSQGKVDYYLIWNRIQTQSGNIIIRGEKIELSLTRYLTVYERPEVQIPYEKVLIASRDAYEKWKMKVLSVNDSSLEEARDIASYITYSCVAPPEGLLTHPAMYMSNNWMTNIWSWDNCFNAIALCKNNPKLAFDQLMMFSLYQDESGVLPDYMNNRSVSYDCTKPPIYGWAYSLMMDEESFFCEPAQLERMYPILKGIEKYWRLHRVSSDFPLPYYNHGNDSGWDNATVFNDGCPVSSPDLVSYLILLYSALIRVSALLNSDEKGKWMQRKEEMKHALITYLWKEDEFVSYIHNLDEYTKGNLSLINLMPLVVADELPKKIIEKMIHKLTQDGFLSDYGVATESMRSSHYEYNGYWRGPIWAPVMLLIIDGLARGGEYLLAKDLARRFCNACNIGGMAENFDPLSGEGLVDPAFTWTSSVFLYLANKYI